jgi:hypothetical protein
MTFGDRDNRATDMENVPFFPNYAWKSCGVDPKWSVRFNGFQKVGRRRIQIDALCFAGRGDGRGPESGESEREPTPELAVLSGVALYLDANMVIQSTKLSMKIDSQ